MSEMQPYPSKNASGVTYAETKDDDTVDTRLAPPLGPTTTTETELHAQGFATDLNHLSKGYYTSKLFLGTFAAVGMAFLSGVSAFAYTAPILSYINADIGPSPSYVWISYVYSTALAVAFPIVGRVSDIFGRRYFFIGGGCVAVVGAIIGATAKDIPTLIVGNMFLGLATSTQLSYHYVLGELVPIEYRYTATAAVYLFALPGSCFAPVIADHIISTYNGNWRILYYMIISYNILALILWITFYFPPDFQHLHDADRKSKRYWLLHFDYLGLVLFASGFVLLLFGISAGGSAYPWKSTTVIVMVVLGGILLVIFVLWECFGPMEHPFIPMHLFKNRTWAFNCVILGCAASTYYGPAVVWPTEVAVLFAGGNLMKAGVISVIPGLCNTFGEVLLGPVINRIPVSHKIQLISVIVIGGTALGCAATVVDNLGVQAAMVVIGTFFAGWVEILLLTDSTILITNQHDIGVAGGTCAGIRSGVSAIATVIYVSVLTEELTANVGTQVPAALIKAGLPESSIAAFIAAIYKGTAAAFASVPGINAAITEAGLKAYSVANQDAYRDVWLCTIIFSGLALVLALFVKGSDNVQSGRIAATLGQELEAEKDPEWQDRHRA